MTTAELQKLFIKRVRERMHILHIDQRELARRANISEVTISRYINGTRIPRIDILVKIAQALECRPGDLINIDELLEF